MTRKNLFSMLTAMFLGLVLALATTNEASAQQNQNCCTYTTDVAVPATCLPFNIQSFWANGFPVVIGVNGVTVHNLPWACPPASVFFGASINGLFPIASFNNPQSYNVNGCVLTVRIIFDANGCPVIFVR